jgi:D-alanyl-D-alanine carboxypeptidase
VRPAPLIRTAILAALLAAATARSADFTPRTCASPMPYAGAPLHAPPDDSLLAGVAGDLARPLPDSLRARLDAAVEAMLAGTKAPAIAAAVGIPGEGAWSAARGMARVTPPAPLAAEPLFHWASVGKAFTSAVIQQLVEEARLGYGDTLARWFPEFPNARAITIDHLLVHTGGVFSFNADLPFRRTRGYSPPGALIQIAARHGSAFCPGEYWAYSNTGYVLLARIIERIEGRPFHEVLTRRVIDRLGLRHTRALAPREHPAGLVTPHTGRVPDTGFDPSTPFGAGVIVGSAGDLVLFWQALLSGRLTSPGSIRAAYRTLYPMYDPGTFYGRGVMLIEFAGAQGAETWLGHGGGTPSARAVVAWDPRSRVFVAVAINADVSTEAAAYRLIREVRAFRGR